jgi:hypothetical protein
MGTLMSLALLGATLVAASGWQFETRTDPIGQTVYVAELRPSAEQTPTQLRFSCGGIVGVELQFNLGQASYDSGAFSTADPPWEDVKFTFAEGAYPTTAKRAPLTDGMGTYEIKGGDAMFIAKLIKAGGEVTIEHNGQSQHFQLEGASDPVTQVIEQCPFKYPDQ